MAKVEISQEDLDFLKNLQCELNKQQSDGNANPVFWGIEETVEEFRGTDGEYGGDPYIRFDDHQLPLEEAIKEVNESLDEYDDNIKKEWEEVDKDYPYVVLEFMQERLGWDNCYDVIYIEKVRRLTDYTGAFITKKACQNYINKYGYNHVEPHTYAMTAFRNPEYERLINILKTLKFE